MNRAEEMELPEQNRIIADAERYIESLVKKYKTFPRYDLVRVICRSKGLLPEQTNQLIDMLKDCGIIKEYDYLLHWQGGVYENLKEKEA